VIESNVERRQMTGRHDVDHDFVSPASNRLIARYMYTVLDIFSFYFNLFFYSLQDIVINASCAGC